MYQIQMAFLEPEYASILYKLAEQQDNIDIIEEKSFNGNLTNIELYISLTVNVIAVIVPVIKTLIKQNKVSSLKMDGKKIELVNVSQDLIEQILKEKIEEEKVNEISETSSEMK